MILVDLSPSNSAINQSVALSCDYILPPANPSIYSCGSVHGLLTSVLTGDKGWLKKHADIVAHQQDVEDESEDRKKAITPWHLPTAPPKMLPILVNNYSRDNGTNKVMLADSQFVYTMMKYVHEGASCRAPPACTLPSLVLTTERLLRRM